MRQAHRSGRSVTPAVLAVMATAFAASAHAADETGKWYLNPQYGYTWLDPSRDVPDGDHLGFGFGYHISEHWSAEINGVWGSFEKGARKLDQSAYSLDALAVFARESRVSPYLSLGAGYIEERFSTDYDAYGPFLQAGAGLMFDVAENSSHTFVFQLRPEVKYRYDWAETRDPNQGDWLVNLGVVFNFGPGRSSPPPMAQAPAPVAAPPPPPPPPPKPLDSDRLVAELGLAAAKHRIAE